MCQLRLVPTVYALGAGASHLLLHGAASDALLWSRGPLICPEARPRATDGQIVRYILVTQQHAPPHYLFGDHLQKRSGAPKVVTQLLV